MRLLCWCYGFILLLCVRLVRFGSNWMSWWKLMLKVWFLMSSVSWLEFWVRIFNGLRVFLCLFCWYWYIGLLVRISLFLWLNWKIRFDRKCWLLSLSIYCLIWMLFLMLNSWRNFVNYLNWFSSNWNCLIIVMGNCFRFVCNCLLVSYESLVIGLDLLLNLSKLFCVSRWSIW